MELQGRLEELTDSGVGVAAISYDAREVLSEFTREHGITYPLLSDVDSRAITDFGIINTVATEGLGPNGDDPDIAADVRKYVAAGGAGEFAVGTPYPGTFKIGPDGKVEARFFEAFYRDRYTTANVMLKLGMNLSPVAAIDGASPQLKFTAYPSNASVFPGSRFSVAVRVEPEPGMHVYAPGAEELGYKVIGLTLDPSPRFRYEPADYPESKIYHFKPLDEHVPAYDDDFTLVQEVVVEATSEAQAALADLDSLTLTGTFNYQACDDEICYLPASVPLSFTLDLVDTE